MIRAGLLALMAALVLAPLAAVAADIDPAVRWADPSRVRLDVEFPGDGYHASWELYRCACGDLLVHSELNMPGEVDTGETLLVGRRVVLSRGFGQHQEELGASLDAPALMMQLALRLLERTVPGGPAAVGEAADVDIREEINHIHLDTGTAVGGFQAPWSVRGRVAPAGDGRRRFDLHFAFVVGSGSEVQQGSMRLSGVASFDGTAFPLAGTASLEGWELTWRDGDDPAAAAAARARTLEELRALLSD